MELNSINVVKQSQRSTEGKAINTSEDTKRTSHSLISQVRRNDPLAWDRLVELYSPLVYFWCKNSGLPASDVQDVFQEVFHALSINIKKFRRINNGTFRGWLRTLTRNKLNDHFRKLGKEARAIGGTEAQQHLEQLPAVELKSDVGSLPDCQSVQDIEIEIHDSILRQALESIRTHFTEQTWDAFWMVVVDGRTADDVALDLAMRPGTVRVAKSRVLKRLRQEIGHDEE